MLKSVSNKAIVDSRPRPECRILTNSTKHCSCLMSNSYKNHHLANSSKHNVVTDSEAVHPLVSWYEKNDVIRKTGST